MTRTKIIEHDERSVSIEFDCVDTGKRVRMDIWAPQPVKYASYVRFNGNAQLCNRLQRTGETLSYYAGSRLASLVRQEYRRMRADEKRARY